VQHGPEQPIGTARPAKVHHEFRYLGRWDVMDVSRTKVTDHYFGLVGKPERFRGLSGLVERVISD